MSNGHTLRPEGKQTERKSGSLPPAGTGAARDEWAEFNQYVAAHPPAQPGEQAANSHNLDPQAEHIEMSLLDTLWYCFLGLAGWLSLAGAAYSLLRIPIELSSAPSGGLVGKAMSDVIVAGGIIGAMISGIPGLIFLGLRKSGLRRLAEKQRLRRLTDERKGSD